MFNSTIRLLIVLLVGMTFASRLAAQDKAAPAQTYGWRGNWTGLYPQADPPLEWGREPKSAVETIVCRAGRPDKDAEADATKAGKPIRQGLIREWLLLGPVAMADAVKDFDKEQVAGEAELAPAEGESSAGKAWKRLELVYKPDYERWGTTELDWVDLAEALPYDPNQVAYACTHLYCPKATTADLVVDHGQGLKVWLNGQALYSQPRQTMGFGSYVSISRQKQGLTHSRSPRVALSLRAGWNRLLLKVSTAPYKGESCWKFAARLLDAGPVEYEDRNIAWVADLGERTNAAPLVIGDRVLTVAEPDQLVCLDKRTGRVLWRRVVGMHDSLTAAEREGAVYREKIAPLVARLEAGVEYEPGLAMRREIAGLLAKLDAKRFTLRWDGHLESHFGIVGFTTTPVSDGRHVWTFFGNGMVACFDLEGNRKWVRRLPTEEIAYSCSPALIGGRLLVVFDGLRCLDGATGEPLWHEPKATSIASLIPGRIAGTDVVFIRVGQPYRVSDGKRMWTHPHIRTGDTGWAAPAVLGQTMYLPWYGVTGLIVADFAQAQGEKWEAKCRYIELKCEHRRPNGEWLDRNTASSPVVWEGLYYNIDQYGVFYAVDLASGATLYKQDVGFDELHHYNAIGVGASATLAGRHLFMLDNQGTCAVVELGRQYKLVAANRIRTLLGRDWPIGPQELLANAPPVFDGRHMYLRGERYLYCVGPKP